MGSIQTGKRKLATGTLQIEVASSIADADAREWDSLVTASSTAAPDCASGNPFLLHAFLRALEESGSATAETGWMPRHLLLRDVDDTLVGALPCYLKSHSQGEYVFDHGWADAFERAGGRYYPKLQCSVPFTPATGPRLLAAKGEKRETWRRALLDGLEQVGEKLGISSAHITFMPRDEWELAGEAGYLLRTDQQFHWTNDGFSGFEDFLAGLSSRKRKNIRKEREAALAGNGIEIDWLSGDRLTEEVWDRFFEFYMDTGSRKWGRPYLTRPFYSMIGETMAERIVLMMARRDGRYIAGAINFIGDGTLFGRHWGCIEDHPFLHFEVCYYQAIDYAIAHGLKSVEAGAQGAHKLARGYLPVTTRSAHWIAHSGLRRAIEDYLHHERRQVEMESEALKRHGPFRKADNP
ncbi:MAG: N-acetyltransferase [Nitratireductor sp.]|nr:N-acetyltransferase [Nitratireductor sp.]